MDIQAALASGGALMQVGITVLIGVVMSHRGTLTEAHCKSLGKLCKDCFLPSLLLSEVGRGVSLQLLFEWWPVPFAAFSFVFIGGYVSQLCWKALYLCDVYTNGHTELPSKIPTFALAGASFPVTTSVPVALLKALPFKVFSLANDSEAEVVASMHSQATSVILLYTLFMTLIRWTYGFQLLSPPSLKNPNRTRQSKTIVSQETDEEATLKLLTDGSVDESVNKSKEKTNLSFYKEALVKSFDTPVVACLIGVCIGIVPILKRTYYGPVFQPLVGALSWLGAGYVPSVMLILGQELWAGSQPDTTSSKAREKKVSHSSKLSESSSGDSDDGDIVVVKSDVKESCRLANDMSGGENKVLSRNLSHQSNGDDNTSVISSKTTKWAIAVSLLTRLVVIPSMFYCFVSFLWKFQTLPPPTNNGEENGYNDQDIEFNHEIYRARVSLALSLLVESAGPAAIILVVMCSLNHYQQKEMARLMLFAYPIGFVTLLIWTTLFMSLLSP